MFRRIPDVLEIIYSSAQLAVYSLPHFEFLTEFRNQMPIDSRDCGEVE